MTNKHSTWLEERIKQRAGLDPDAKLSEAWLRESIDELDKNATSANLDGIYGGHIRSGMTLLTPAEAEKEIQKARTLKI